MITPEKIAEWIKEAEQRPSSAPLIIQNLASRLRHLSQRNEELLDENIALNTGKRVEEYERRIAHLEYQLDLLKRQLAGDGLVHEETGEERQPETPAPVESGSLIIFDSGGHLLRFSVNPESLSSGQQLTRLQDDLAGLPEPPGMLGVSGSAELLLVFSSGRVTAIPASDVPAAPTDQPSSLEQSPVPDEPRGGEQLVCLVPISNLPLVDFLVQVSRKGYVKKIGANMIESILANHYIGSGVMLPADQTFHVALCASQDQLVLVSRQGYLLRVYAGQTSHAIHEAIRLEKSDYLVSAFLVYPGQSILAATQGGKLVLRTEDSFETAESFKTKGKPLFSQSRREQGVRVVGAAALSQTDWGAALHAGGQLTLHSMADVFASGTIPVQDDLLAFAPLVLARSSRSPSSEG